MVIYLELTLSLLCKTANGIESAKIATKSDRYIVCVRFHRRLTEENAVFAHEWKQLY